MTWVKDVIIWGTIVSTSRFSVKEGALRVTRKEVEFMHNGNF
jgi:hypothetical protein